jgi:hypothetical protein
MFKTKDPLSYFQMALVTRHLFLLLCVITRICKISLNDVTYLLECTYFPRSLSLCSKRNKMSQCFNSYLFHA